MFRTNLHSCLVAVSVIWAVAARGGDAETLRADVIWRSKLVEAKDANGAWNWTDGARFPNAETDYVIRHFTRTPQTSEGYVFGGKSLTLVSGGSLNLKPTANVAYTFPRRGLILSGGVVAHLAHGARVTLAGRITTTAPVHAPVVFRPAPDESVRTAFDTSFALDASLESAPGCSLRITADRSRNDPQFANWGIVELNGNFSTYRGILDVRDHGVAIFNNPAPFPGTLSVGTNGYLGVTNIVTRTFSLPEWNGGGFWLGFDPDSGNTSCIVLPMLRQRETGPLHLFIFGVKAVRPACAGRTYGPLLKVPASSGITAKDMALEVKGYDAFVPLPRFRLVARDEADGMRAFYAEACQLTDEERKQLPYHIWMDEPPDQTWTVTGQYPEVRGVRRAVIFEGNEANGAYNHHAKIVFAHGRFHAAWSNQRYDEDGPGQRVLYASSEDGLHWGDPRELVPALSPETPWGGSGVFCQAGDFFEQGDRLFALAAVTEITGWQNKDKTKSSPVHTRECGWPVYASRGCVVREIRKDGTFGPLRSRFKGVRPEILIRPVQPLDEAEPRFKFPSREWNDMNALRQMPERRLCESIAWKKPGGGFVGLFRDDSGSGYKWMSFSDDGYKWTKPHITDMHDAQSLTRALALDDGTILLVGNHRGLGRSVPGVGWCDRDPLMISVSRDGIHFSNTHTVREGYYRFKVWPGPRARGGSAQYPHLIVHDGMCYVIYSLGKESIETSCFPLANLIENDKMPTTREKE